MVVRIYQSRAEDAEKGKPRMTRVRTDWSGEDGFNRRRIQQKTDSTEDGRQRTDAP